MRGALTKEQKGGRALPLRALTQGAGAKGPVKPVAAPLGGEMLPSLQTWSGRIQRLQVDGWTQRTVKVGEVEHQKRKHHLGMMGLEPRNRVGVQSSNKLKDGLPIMAGVMEVDSQLSNQKQVAGTVQTRDGVKVAVVM